MPSLQDQLLNAGLVDKKAAKQANKEKAKQHKANKNKKEKTISETQQAAKQALAEKTARDRETNLKLKQQTEKKAIQAQIIQLIKMNKIDKGKGDIGYNFTDQNIKKIYITKALQEQLSKGRLAIVKLTTANKISYELVAPQIAEKIAQRDDSFVVLLNEKNKEPETDSKDDDWYADYEIPDDLMW